MKFISLIENPHSRFIYFDGEVAELNSSVLDLYEKKQKEQAKDPEDIITQAKQLALSEVPDAAKDLLEGLGKKFTKLKDFENKKTVEEAKTAVRDMVFDIIEEGVSRYPSWGDNLQDMVDDIQNDEHEAISTIRDTKRGKETVSKALEQYEREASVIKASLKKDNEVKRKLGFLWKTGEVANSSDEALFKKFSDDAVAEIKSIGSVFVAREKEAGTINTETKNIISDGFKALSPEDQAEFLSLAKDELSATPATDHISAATSTQVQAVANGTHVLNRVEIYHEIFDFHASKLLGKSSKKVDQQIKEIADRESFIDKRTTAVLTESNVQTVKDELKDSIPNKNFQSADMSGLNNDIKLYFQSAGIDINPYFTLTGAKKGKALPANQLNDYETFVALFDAMVNNPTSLTGMPQELKKQVLAACNWLEGISVAENEEGYSQDFVNARTEIVRKQSNISQSLKHDLSPIKTVEDLKSNQDKITLVKKRIGEFKVTKANIEALVLESDTEKQKLEAFLATMEPIIQKINELLIQWENELKTFKGSEKSAKDDWEKAKQEKKALELRRDELQTHHTNLTSAGAVAADIANAKTALDAANLRVTEKDTEIATLDTVHTSFATSGTAAKNTNITDPSDFIAEQFPVLADLATQLSDTKLKTVKANKIREEVIAANFVYNSMRQNKDLYKARFNQLQEEQFTLLKGCNRGEAINLKMAPFSHGHDIPDAATIGNLKGFNKAIVMEKTDDAVILIAGTRLIVVQQSTDSRKFQVLQMSAPKGFKPSDSLPPDYFPDNAVVVGELIKLNAA